MTINPRFGYQPASKQDRAFGMSVAPRNVAMSLAQVKACIEWAVAPPLGRYAGDNYSPWFSRQATLRLPRGEHRSKINDNHARGIGRTVDQNVSHPAVRPSAID